MARDAFLEGARRLAIAVGWIVAFVLVGVAVSVVLNSIVRVPSTSPWWLLALSGGQALAVLAATWLVGWRLNRRTWEAMGWRREGGKGLGARFGRGVALALLMAAVAIGLSSVTSGVRITVTGDWQRWLPVALPLLLGLVCAALTEELVFRGYPLGRLTEAIGPWAAMAVLVLAFGLLHAGNPNAGPFGVVNVILAGVWLSFAYFSAGGMGYAWGLHFGWNAGLAAVFDAPVSGYRFAVPAVEYYPGAHQWVDGGAFGPEGGLVATIVIIAGTLAVLGSRVPQPRTWVAG